VLQFVAHLLNLEVPPLELFDWWLAIPYAVVSIVGLVRACKYLEVK
jgi:hypothetical protein